MQKNMQNMSCQKTFQVYPKICKICNEYAKYVSQNLICRIWTPHFADVYYMVYTWYILGYTMYIHQTGYTWYFQGYTMYFHQVYTWYIHGYTWYDIIGCSITGTGMIYMVYTWYIRVVVYPWTRIFLAFWNQISRPAHAAGLIQCAHACHGGWSRVFYSTTSALANSDHIIG